MSSPPRVIQEKIGHLLPNPQILNFYTGVPTLPESITGTLRLMMGAGDLDQGDIPNTARFSTYNVFFCEPWDNNGSLLQNVKHILTTPGRLLCFIDIQNPEHISAFTRLFAGRFSFIDGFGGHCPHFDMDALQVLLADGGRAANVYELGEAIITKRDIEFWLEHDRFNGAAKMPPAEAEDRNAALLTSRLQLNPDDLPKITEKLREKVLRTQESCTQVKIEPKEINSADIRTLQHYARMQMYDKNMPPNLTGIYTMSEKDWRPPMMEFIVTKQPLDFHLELGLIEAYEARHGVNSPPAKQARVLITGIRADIPEKRIVFAKLRYSRLQSVIALKIKPALVGGSHNRRKSRKNRHNKTRHFRK